MLPYVTHAFLIVSSCTCAQCLTSVACTCLRSSAGVRSLAARLRLPALGPLEGPALVRDMSKGKEIVLSSDSDETACFELDEHVCIPFLCVRGLRVLSVILHRACVVSARLGVTRRGLSLACPALTRTRQSSANAPPIAARGPNGDLRSTQTMTMRLPQPQSPGNENESRRLLGR